MICPSCKEWARCPACGGDLAAPSAQPLRELSEDDIETCYALFRGHEIPHSRPVWLNFARAVLTAARSAK